VSSLAKRDPKSQKRSMKTKRDPVKRQNLKREKRGGTILYHPLKKKKPRKKNFWGGELSKGERGKKTGKLG